MYKISTTEVYFKSKTRATKSREQVIAVIQELFLEQDIDGMVVSPLTAREHEPAHYYVRDPDAPQHVDVPLDADYVDRGDWSKDDLKEFEGRF